MPRDLGGGQWHPGGASHLSGRPLVLFGIHCLWRGGRLSMRGASCPWGDALGSVQSWGAMPSGHHLHSLLASLVQRDLLVA